MAGLALLGCGVFARDAYVPIFKLYHDIISLRFVWSRSEHSALQLFMRVRDFAVNAEAVWGEEGLERILASPLVQCCAVVLPILSQPAIVLRAIRAGKHVLQEKPVAGSVVEGIQALEAYSSLQIEAPIWAVAENFRFEPAFHEAHKLVQDLGTMVVATVAIEIPMNTSNKYFHCEWRRDPALKGGFILDCGVHFVAALRVMTGREITSVAAIATHRDSNVPAPDTLTTLMSFENGCSGTMVISFAASTSKMSWRVVCSEGTVEVERGVQDGRLGYSVALRPLEGKPCVQFHPFTGLEAEMKAFIADVQQAVSGGSIGKADLRSSPREALRDLAIVEAALVSGSHADAPITLKPTPIPM